MTSELVAMMIFVAASHGVGVVFSVQLLVNNSGE